MNTDLFDKVPITIYTPHNGVYKRKVIKGCILIKDIELSFKSQGILPLNTCKLYIPYDSEFVDEKLFKGEGWTIKIGSDKKTSYIVEGICNFNFSKYGASDLPKAIREFESNYEYKKPKFIKKNYANSSSLNHIEVIC